MKTPRPVNAYQRMDRAIASQAMLQNVIYCARRLGETPAGQGFLALDRLADLELAIFEYRDCREKDGLREVAS